MSCSVKNSLCSCWQTEKPLRITPKVIKTHQIFMFLDGFSPVLHSSYLEQGRGAASVTHECQILCCCSWLLRQVRVTAGVLVLRPLLCSLCDTAGKTLLQQLARTWPQSPTGPKAHRNCWVSLCYLLVIVSLSA